MINNLDIIEIKNTDFIQNIIFHKKCNNDIVYYLTNDKLNHIYTVKYLIHKTSQFSKDIVFCDLKSLQSYLELL